MLVIFLMYNLNRSPTSQTCHQQIWSPTSVTNIDVTQSLNWSRFDQNQSVAYTSSVSAQDFLHHKIRTCIFEHMYVLLFRTGYITRFFKVGIKR